MKNVPRIVGKSRLLGARSSKEQSLGGLTVAGKFVLILGIERVVVAELQPPGADNKVFNRTLKSHPAAHIGDIAPLGWVVVAP